MSKHHRSQFTVEWGDCDPAQIVFYPNFFRWMDAASLRFFRAAGVPPWREFEAQSGIIGTPLVDASARFLRPATYGDVIDIDTAIDEFMDSFNGFVASSSKVGAARITKMSPAWLGM